MIQAKPECAAHDCQMHRLVIGWSLKGPNECPSAYGPIAIRDWKLLPAFRAAALRYGSIVISVAGGYYLFAALKGA
jgi:hypothetical protein